MGRNNNLMLCEGDASAFHKYKDSLIKSGFAIRYSASTVRASFKVASDLDENSILAAIVGDNFPDGDADEIAREINDLRLGIPVIGIWLHHVLEGATLNINQGMFPSKLLLDYLSSW